jgi:hypothetical protein
MTRQAATCVAGGWLLTSLTAQAGFGWVGLQQRTLPAAQRRDYSAKLQSIAQALGKRYDCTILVGSDIVLRSAPLAPVGAPSITEALSTLAAPHKDLAWRRAHLPASQADPAPSKLAAWARSLDRIEVHGIAIEDLKRNRETVLLKELPLDAEREKSLGPPAFRRKSLYILYSRTATDDGKTVVERFADLERQQAELMSKLTPEQMPNPMLQTMQLLQSLEPAAMQEFAVRMGTAGSQLWERTPPDQRKEMMADAMKVMQTYSGRPGEAPRPRPSATYLADLKRIAKELGQRLSCTVLIDPALYLTARPAEPPVAADIETALEEVIRPLSGVGKRLLLLPAQPAGESGPHMPAPGKLAQAVRELETIEQKSIILEDPWTRRAASFVQSPGALSVLKHEEGRPDFSPQRIYLLYAISAGAQTPADLRYADLQRQQLELMLHMAPEDLSQAMEQGIQRYQTQPEGTRTSTMGLPMMAGMMASWFPLAAKEGREKP